MIDEAGQATEPETTAVIANLLDPSTGQLVLAGDPKQLGPIIHADVAKRLKLDVSFIERLTWREAYQKISSGGGGDDDGAGVGGEGAYNPHLLTKLVRNYRSHEDIISVPSTLFYDGDLVPCADEEYRRSLARWEHLPAKGVPLIFHGVAGKDSRESSSPSWFNVHEIEVRAIPSPSAEARWLLSVRFVGMRFVVVGGWATFSLCMASQNV